MLEIEETIFNCGLQEFNDPKNKFVLKDMNFTDCDKYKSKNFAKSVIKEKNPPINRMTYDFKFLEQLEKLTAGLEDEKIITTVIEKNIALKNSDILNCLNIDDDFDSKITDPFNFDSFLLTESSQSNYFGYLRGLDTDIHSVLSSMSSTKLIITALDVLHSFTILSTGVKVDAIVGRLNEISTLFLRDGVFFGQCSDCVE